MSTSHVAQSDAPALQADDLKLIHGIGPGIAARLNAAGISTFIQLAGMSPDEVVLALGNVVGLTVKRVVDQDWVGQAGKLAPVRRAGLSNGGKVGRQHYATFAIELLLDENNNVRRTHAVNIQSEAEDTWAGWDERRLLEFMAQKAGLKTESHALETQAESTPPTNLPAPQPKLAELGGQARLNRVLVKSLETGRQSRILANSKPFEIETSIDLTGLVAPGDSAVNYVAHVRAKALGENPGHQIGEMQGVFNLAQSGEFVMQCAGLKEGTYRLQVDLSLVLPRAEPASQRPLTSLLDGGLLKVY
jgi:hypothetical protein